MKILKKYDYLDTPTLNLKENKLILLYNNRVKVLNRRNFIIKTIIIMCLYLIIFQFLSVF